MLCPGVTVFISLIRNGAGPSGKVGGIAIGGFGHYALPFANALGAEVYASSRPSIWPQVEDIKKLGTLYLVVMNEDYAKELASELDPILSARDVAGGFPWMEYMSMFDVHGHFVTDDFPTNSLLVQRHVIRMP